MKMNRIRSFVSCSTPKTSSPNTSDEDNTENNAKDSDASGVVQTFTYDQLTAAAAVFMKPIAADTDDTAETAATDDPYDTVGKGGSGTVYRGMLPNNQQVAIKYLRRPKGTTDGATLEWQFNAEVSTLSRVDHRKVHNLVKLIGYCIEGDRKAVVYEYMPLGSLEKHLRDLKTSNKTALDWKTRMKIATSAATGLNYLHHKLKPPVIYADMKCSNILLGKGYASKLSDFGLATEGPVYIPDENASLIATPGYCEPDYKQKGGQLTLKSDIYGFGVVLLEIITGHKGICCKLSSTSAPDKKHNVYLVDWATRLLRDKSIYSRMADSLLEDQYPKRAMYEVLSLAVSCLVPEAEDRPTATELVNALTMLRKRKVDGWVSCHRRTWSCPLGGVPGLPATTERGPEKEMMKKRETEGSSRRSRLRWERLKLKGVMK